MNTLVVHVDSMIRIPLPASAELLAMLRGELTFRVKSQRAGARGGKKDSLALYYQDQNQFLIPRGSVPLLRRLTGKLDIELGWRSGVASFAKANKDKLSDTLRDYQRETAEKMLDSVQAVISIPTGGGKTYTGASAIIASGEPALVIAPTKDIRKQWVETFHTLGVKHVRELVGPTKWTPLKPGEIAVGLVQSFRGHPREQEFLNSLGAVLMDETHHAAARTWMEVLNRCPARYRWGVTATPRRADGLGDVVTEMIGPLYVGATVKMLVEQGHLMFPKIVPVRSHWEPTDKYYPLILRCPECNKVTEAMLRWIRGGFNCKGHDEDCWQRLTEEDTIGTGKLSYATAVTDMSKDGDRNNIISELAQAAHDHRRCTLILVPRVEAAKALCAQLRRAGVLAAFVSGGSKKEERELRIQQMRDGDLLCLVATKIADEGLDIPSINCMIMASPGRDSGKALQKIGRAVRPGEKQPVIFDIVDMGEFESQWGSRSWGYWQTFGYNVLHSREPVSLSKAILVLAD